MIKIKKLIKVAKVFSITGRYLKYAGTLGSDVINLKSRWAFEIINHFKINIQIIGNPVSQNIPCLLVGNHISYLDMPILLASCPAISFVSKKEVKSWPIIGNAAMKAQTIFVERNKATSRTAAKAAITKSLLQTNQKVVIFPSGTTSIRTSSFWKKGAFEIAEKNDIYVQPFRIRYNPLSTVAYVGRDNFLLHMYQLFKLKQIDVSLEFHEPIMIKDSIADCSYWKKWCEE